MPSTRKQIQTRRNIINRLKFPTPYPISIHRSYYIDTDLTEDQYLLPRDQIYAELLAFDYDNLPERNDFVYHSTYDSHVFVENIDHFHQIFRSYKRYLRVEYLKAREASFTSRYSTTSNSDDLNLLYFT